MIKNAVIVGDNITPAVYNTEPSERGSKAYALRAHALAEILRNAKRWVRGYESPETKSMEFGTLYDCLLLEPFQFSKRFAILPPDAPRKPSERQINAKKPSPATVEAIEWWKEWLANNPGEIVKPELNASVHVAIHRLQEDNLICELIACSAKQVMVKAEWHDLPTGLVVPLKCLIDIVPDYEHPVFGNSLWDLKSTRNASPRFFARDAQRYMYHLQAGFYSDMFNAASGQNRSDFGHIVQEAYPPYEYRTPPPLLSQRFFNFGKLAYQSALSLYCRSLASGEWPSYDQQNSKSWPLTDCEDWFLDMASIYQPIEDEDEAEAEEETDAAPPVLSEEPADLIP